MEVQLKPHLWLLWIKQDSRKGKGLVIFYHGTYPFYDHFKLFSMSVTQKALCEKGVSFVEEIGCYSSLKNFRSAVLHKNHRNHEVLVITLKSSFHTSSFLLYTIFCVSLQCARDLKGKYHLPEFIKKNSKNSPYWKTAKN